MNKKSKKLELAYGDPIFLQELHYKYWPKIKDDLLVDSKPFHGSYKYSKQTLPELEKVIKSLHKKYKNVRITDKTKIIVTHGAVQALSAALWYYHKIGCPSVWIKRPYWGRFRDLISNVGLKIFNNHAHGVFLLTFPNNPDGEYITKEEYEGYFEVFGKDNFDIMDACYNWPFYLTDVNENAPLLLFKNKVVVFSLSKATGFSSTRIGWVVTEDPEAAKFIQEYIETFTSGVTVDGQLKAAKAIKATLLNKEISFAEDAKSILNERAKKLRNIVNTYKIPIKILSEGGMFWYVESKLNLPKLLNAECYRGAYFTDYYKDELDRYRFNIGCSTEDFNEFLKRLQKLRK